MRSSDPRRHPIYALGIVALLALLGSAYASASSSPPCNMRLVVELTPDVPDPHDPGFLSSLLSNHPGYQLRWVRSTDGFTVVLDLTGPGADDQCNNVIQTMRNDARVLSISVQAEPIQSVFVPDSREPSPIGSSLHLFT